MEKLYEFEKLDSDTLRKQGSHQVELARLVKRARERLEQIKQDDVDYLMSFRITGKNRIWCIDDRNIMNVLWWDPDHSVCPSLQKYT